MLLIYPLIALMLYLTRYSCVKAQLGKHHIHFNYSKSLIWFEEGFVKNVVSYDLGSCKTLPIQSFSVQIYLMSLSFPKLIYQIKKKGTYFYWQVYSKRFAHFDINFKTPYSLAVTMVAIKNGAHLLKLNFN